MNRQTHDQKSNRANRELLESIQFIRKSAREHLESGAVTSTYVADQAMVIQLLNGALATELVCVLRYKAHYEMAKGINSIAIAEEFNENAKKEQEHADKLAKRISQLGGKPNYDPKGLCERAHTDYVEGASLKDMIKEDLIAERIAIGIYQECIRYIGNDDPTTRILLEEILADEEEHADELSNILFEIVKPSDVHTNIRVEAKTC